jgi:hypothetical protein
MKKHLLMYLLFLGTLMSAQITVSESFEGTTLPAGWVSSITGSGFSSAPSGYGASAGTSCAGSKAVYKNIYGTTYTSWYMTYSSTASNATALNYSFKYLAKGFSTTGNISGSVAADYSVDGGTTWSDLLAPVTLNSPNATPIPCTTVSGTIPAGTIPAGANFKLRLKSTSTTTGDFYMGFDDVVLSQVATTAPSCVAISSPANAATGVSLTPTITWPNAAGASSYVINMGITPGGTQVMAGMDVGNTTSYTVPAATLAYSTMYYITIIPKNSFGSATGCAETSFTTVTIPCPTVTAPASAATGVSLTPTITWTALSGATGYKLSVGTTSGGTDVLNNVDLGNVTSYSFSTPLINSTQYYYTLNAYSAGSISSSCTVRNFTTVCSAIVPSYTNNFTSTAGACTSQASGGSPTGTAPTGATANWVQNNWLNTPAANTGTGSMRMNLFFTNVSGWLRMPPLNLSAGGYRVKFDYAVTTYSGTAASAMGSDDVVQFVVSQDGGNTWTVLQTWNKANGPSNTSNTYSLDLTGYTGANTIFAFYGSDGTVDDAEDYNFYIDNFVVEPMPVLAVSEVSNAKNNIKIYPNPFSEVLNISDASDVKNVQITDGSGRLLKIIANPGNELHLGDLKQGMYLVTLEMKDGSKQTIKAIKK